MTGAGTVFLVDDDEAVRHALALLLEQEGLRVLPFAGAEEFLAGYRPVPHSCAIVDIRMRGMSGIELQREILQRGIRLPVIILTGHGDIAAAVDAVKLGATDFLTKPVTGKVLVAALESAFRESDRIDLQVDAAEPIRTDLQELTPREREVLELAKRGLGNKEIARKLDISYRTVEIHRSRVMHKTGARNLLELVRLSESVSGALQELLVLVTRAPVSIAVLDRDMRYLACSPSWMHQFARGRRELTGLSYYDLNPNLPSSWMAIYQRALAGEFVKGEKDRWIDTNAVTHLVKWMVGPWRTDLGEIGGITIYSEILEQPA
jgi:FixJ family two-component response regulator